MSDVVFVRTRHFYQPYADFHRLIQVSGYPLVYIDEMDIHDPSKTYILSPKNGEWGDYTHARARLIWWQLEWEQTPEPLPAGVAEKWTSDAWHSDRINARFVPLGSHPCLSLNPDERRDKRYDVIYLQCPSYRRYGVWGEVEKHGLTVAPDGWGYQRHERLLEARAMIHVHQHDSIPTIAPLRWCIAAAYRLPVISETVANRAPFGYTHFMTSDYQYLAEFAAMHLRDKYTNLEGYGGALHQKLCHELTFRKSVEATL